jgi:hypothetical protein
MVPVIDALLRTTATPETGRRKVSAATLILSPGLIQRSLHIEAPRDPDADEDGGSHSCGRDRVMRLLDWVAIFRYTWTLFRLMSRTLLGLHK